MPKSAIKANKKILEKDVFLRRAYDGYMQYGKLELLDKRQGHTNVIGKIKENLLQEDVIIKYKDDLEKFKIFAVIPREFYYKDFMDEQKIVISFKHTNIKAHLFTNREYAAGIYKFLTCFDEEQEVLLPCTLKTPELSAKILQMHKQIVEIQKSYFPKDFLTLEDAKKDVKSYLIYLMENYEVEVIEAELNEYLANLRKLYNNSDLELFEGLLKNKNDGFKFQFIYKGKEYQVTVGSRVADEYYEDFGEFVNVYNEEAKA